MAATDKAELQYSTITKEAPTSTASPVWPSTTNTTPSVTISMDLEPKKETKAVHNLYGNIPTQQSTSRLQDENVSYPPNYIEHQSTDTTTRTSNSVPKDPKDPLHSVYNNGSHLNLWCFCFCVKSSLCPNFIEKCIYKLKLKNDILFQKKLHCGACRFVSLTVLIWILISLFFASSVFIIAASLSCMMDEYEWNNQVFNETCFVKSYHSINCSSLYNLIVLNSDQCNENRIYNLSLDEYTTNYNDNECLTLASRNTYTLNGTYPCWMRDCDDNDVHFTYPTFDHWYCGYVPLTTGIILLCVGQCCIINIKQFCCSRLCGKC